MLSVYKIQNFLRKKCTVYYNIINCNHIEKSFRNQFIENILNYVYLILCLMINENFKFLT